MARQQNIAKIIERLEIDPRVMVRQDENIARIVLFYEGVCESLKDKVPAGSIHQVAATLTAGYWASPN